MDVGTLPPVSNKADWKFVREVIDDDTGDPIDLSGATIVFEVTDDCGSAVLSATTANGKISILDTGVFQAAFTPTEMKALCAISYDVGCTITNAGETRQFIIGTMAVLNGVVTQ